MKCEYCTNVKTYGDTIYCVLKEKEPTQKEYEECEDFNPYECDICQMRMTRKAYINGGGFCQECSNDMN